MCFQEYIAYQCGHRSPGVVRPCPMTTASEHFPVCRTQATKQHNAFTMCASCERHLHFRWVLIREWEHRWMHERGVCGCDVVFPGLLNRPRVSGLPAGLSSAGPLPTIATAGGGAGVSGAASGAVPAKYAEVVSGGGHHVAVRVPGLYAAEWVGDHCARHRAGQCHCAVNFEPFQPEVGEGELTRHEHALLHDYRELEDGNNSLTLAETAERVDEITSLFGSFIVATPSALSGAAVAPAAAMPAPAILAATDVDNNPFHSHSQGDTHNHPRAQPYDPTPGTAATHTHISPLGLFRTQTPPHHQVLGYTPYPRAVSEPPQAGSWALPPLPPLTHTPTSPHPHPLTHHRTPPSATPTLPTQAAQRPVVVSTPLLSTYRTPPSAPGTSTNLPPPQYHPPHPASLTLPHPFWPAPRALATTPPTNLGPGPFTTAGLSYTPPSSPRPRRRTRSVPMPFCGLPIGAGPEGEASHVGGWDGCRLSRGTTPVVGVGMEY
ncbi:hypothetical protein B0H67DRAFT_640131 [Lasiosphaeris hirsuta]|uniref:Uncharacterized protein n=1 Tax=Lasiosphaeris hirsuta TaxID=260670 RepID=A0AA40BCN0_9PEZI|nr:hypothetical protein B0H67DRAFT_640131 [Lasiosphaeris hirsuta]